MAYESPNGAPRERLLKDETIAFDVDQPLRLRLGKTSLVIARRYDIPQELDRVIHPEIPGLLYAPDYFNDNTGFKGLREQSPVTIGRAQYPDRLSVLSDDPYISGRHATIELRGAKFYITDENSTNGTFVYEQPTALQTRRPEVARTIEAGMRTVAIDGYSESKYGRVTNEDAMMYSEAYNCAGVFDGLGGHAGSEAAARLAAEVAKDMLASVSEDMPPSLAKMTMEDVLLRAHNHILRSAENSNIMTTATITKVFHDTQTNQRYAAVASVGDSRAYMYRDGALRHITLDHNRLMNLDEESQRRIQTTLSNFTRLEDITDPDAQILFYERHRIASALGQHVERVPISSVIVPIKSDDVLLLTTDGIHDNLTDVEISDGLESYFPEKSLVHAAKERSSEIDNPRAKPDDMTAVVMQIK